MKQKSKTVKDVIVKDPALYTVLNKAQRLIKMRSLISGVLPLELQSQCNVANYRQGVLIIHVTSAAWGTRLRMLLPHLLKRLKLVNTFSRLNKIEIKVRLVENSTKSTLPHAELSDYGKSVLKDLKQQLPK